ncbi:MAG: hypothetical protein HC889_00620 [Synechococcaceae cyanobacterium SM1_2_3]|nr:hypothetical protein [Synechococcaceae cyanobacterium SM1_2_3]
MTKRKAAAVQQAEPALAYSLTPRQQEAHALLGGPQRHTMLVGGSRSGKTWLICRQIMVRAHRFPGTRHVILRARLNACKQSIGLDTMPNVLQTCFPDMGAEYEIGLARWVLPGGSEVWLGGLDDKERVDKILGKEFASIYFNEASQIAYASVKVALTRLAQTHDDPGFTQRAYYDLNPTGDAHFTYKQFIKGVDPDTGKPLAKPENYKWMRINPEDNRQNLTEEYLEEQRTAAPATRRRFYLGEYSPSVPNALWTLETLERGRRDKVTPADLERLGITRVIIGVDPSGADGADDDAANAIGIVVMGRQPGRQGHGFVLEDATLTAHPKVWAKTVTALADKWGANMIVAEKNFGGEMVRHTIKMADPDCYVPVKVVTASRGKHIRAEPVAGRYAETDDPESGRTPDGPYRGMVHHCGEFPELEAEMTAMSSTGYRGEGSPNRLDALVWAGSELFGKAVVSENAMVAVGGQPLFAKESLN